MWIHLSLSAHCTVTHCTFITAAKSCHNDTYWQCCHCDLSYSGHTTSRVRCSLKKTAETILHERDIGIPANGTAGSSWQRHEQEMKQVWQLFEKQHADRMHTMKGLIKVVSKKSKKSERDAESSSISGSWIVAFSSRLHAVTYKSLQTWHDGQKLRLRPTSQQIEFIGFLHL